VGFLLGCPNFDGAGGCTLRAFGLLVVLVALVLCCLLSLAVGARSISLGTVIDALASPVPAAEDHAIVRELRVPRTLLGLMVGVALGLTGALLQGLTRNPLADPAILGISAGAALAAACAVLLLGVAGVYGYVWFAFAGAAAAGAAVYAIGSLGRGGAGPVKLALAGAGLTALLTSLTSLVLLVDLATLNALRFWLVGSLAGRDGSVARQVAPFIALGVVVALACGRSLNALSLGDDVARSLGVRLGRARALAGGSAVGLAGAATAAAGPIAFVSLAVPHAARAIAGPDYRWVLPYSAALAPVLLLGSDVLGRVIAPSGEVQVGVVTVLLGAPLFVALVRRRRVAEL
jgi:iron complex transport system permease protein